MDLFHAIKERWSCRKYLPDPISDTVLQQILEAATCAPSPANNQPWEFVVITNSDVKNRIFSDTEQCKNLLLEKSGWKWLGSYKVDFLREAPVIIAIVGNPKKTGRICFWKEAVWVISRHVRRRSRTCSWLRMLLALEAFGSPCLIKVLSGKF